MKFCFVCGKRTEKLIEGYCEDCYNKNFNLIEIPKELIILKCSKCGKIKLKNIWSYIEIEDFIKNHIKILGNNVELEINDNKIFAKGFLKTSKKAKEEIHEINIKIKKILCSNCCRKSGGYYEAVIQLRGSIPQNILNFIDKEAREKTFYRIENVKNGINLYIGNKNIADQIADKLKRRYKLEIKKSFKLFTKKEGKDVYKSVFSIKCD